jgi:hypothetical protein
MVRESGLDAAEAKPRESEHVAAPRTAAANKIDLKLFMRKSLCFRAWIPCCRRARSSLRAPGVFSRKGDRCQARLSALLHRTRERKTFVTSLAIKQTVSPPCFKAYNRKSGQQSVSRREDHGSRHAER